MSLSWKTLLALAFCLVATAANANGKNEVSVQVTHDAKGNTIVLQTSVHISPTPNPPHHDHFSITATSKTQMPNGNTRFDRVTRTERGVTHTTAIVVHHQKASWR